LFSVHLSNQSLERLGRHRSKPPASMAQSMSPCGLHAIDCSQTCWQVAQAPLNGYVQGRHEPRIQPVLGKAACAWQCCCSLSSCCTATTCTCTCTCTSGATCVYPHRPYLGTRAVLFILPCILSYYRARAAQLTQLLKTCQPTCSACCAVLCWVKWVQWGCSGVSLCMLSTETQCSPCLKSARCAPVCFCVPLCLPAVGLLCAPLSPSSGASVCPCLLVCAPLSPSSLGVKGVSTGCCQLFPPGTACFPFSYF
jgi:hypothetical protein